MNAFSGCCLGVVHEFVRCVATLLLVATPCLAFAQTPSTGSGQAYPVKPVRLIAPFPPGGSSDLIARIVAQRLSEGFPYQVIIENRPGASSNLGAQIASRAAPDGYTLLITSVTATINVSIFRNPGYDLVKDFAPISKLAVGPTALVVHPSVPAHNVPQFIKLAQSRPGQLNLTASRKLFVIRVYERISAA